MRGFLLGALALLAHAGCGSERAPRPHVLLIVADDLGWADVGYHGSEIRTPSIDGLAASGVRAERFYVLPTCSPTRAALLTGRYPIRYGLQRDVVRPWARYGLDPGERTLAEALRDAGYATALVGKWHLGMARPELLPTSRGFQHHYGPYGGMVDYFGHTRAGGLDWHRNREPVVETGYATDLLAAEAVRVVEAHDPAQPLFLMLSFTAPHVPLQAPPDELASYAQVRDESRRRFAAMVSRMDRGIGEVLGAFERAGMRERTLTVFLSDNGGYPPGGGRNQPLRAGKGGLLEGGVRVPAVWSWPGRLPAGATSEAPMHAVDLFATLSGLTGLRADSRKPLDGIDLLPVLRGARSPEREILLNLDEGAGAAIRAGRWKLIVSGPLESPALTALFDLVADPDESRDLSGQEPERVRALRARLEDYAEVAAAPLSSSSRRPAGFRAPAVWGPAAP